MSPKRTRGPKRKTVAAARRMFTVLAGHNLPREGVISLTITLGDWLKLARWHLAQVRKAERDTAEHARRIWRNP